MSYQKQCPIKITDNVKVERTGRHSVFLVILAYILLFALIIGANPFAGETSAPMDIISQYQGWSSHHFTGTPTHPARSDILDALIPQWITLKEAIRGNEYGIWNPVSSNGVPGVLDASRSVFTPSFLAFLLTDEHWLGFYFAGLLKLVIAGVGAFLFLRLFVGFVAAFFGGAVFACCGFNAAWFYWPQVSTSPWIPWLLWACAGWYLFKDKKWIFLIVFSTVMLVLGGFPAVAAYGLYSAVLFAILFSLYKRIGFKNAIYLGGVMLASIAVAFLIISIPLLGLYDALDLIDLGYRRGGTPFVVPKDFALFVNPHLYGLPPVEKTLYVGNISLGLALVSVFLFFKKNVSDKILLLILFGFVLLLCTIALAFGLLPREFILLIPVFGMNPWSRIVVLAGMAIAILAAVAFDYAITRTMMLKNNVLKMVAMVALFAGAGYQVYDQSVLFREFNNIAVRQDFFPSTPAIDHVKANLKGLQSVVADNAFMVSGTLGAYGIPEWFAHGFKTNIEKNVLSQIVTNPFVTTTAATFTADHIRFDNDLFSKLGIRYILVEAGNGTIVRSQPLGQHIPAPAMPGNSLAQIVRIEEPVSITGVGVVLATYGARQAPSDVSLEIVSSWGEVLAKALLKAEAVRDNQNAIFTFGKNIELLPGSYELRIGLVDSKADGRLTTWYTRNVKHQGDLIHINDEKLRGAMLYSFYNENLLPYEQGRWRGHDEIKDKILVVENLTAPEGAYFVQSLAPDSGWTGRNVHTERLGAESITVQYLGNEAGYIVLPIRWFSGWVAYQNGAKKVPESYLGMLLALKVDGPSEIEFSYEPTYLGLGLSLTFIGVFCLLFLIYIVDIKKMSVCVATEEKK